MKLRLYWFIVLHLSLGGLWAQTSEIDQAYEATESFLKEYKKTFPVHGKLQIDTIIIDVQNISIHFKRAITYAPVRQKTVDDIYAKLRTSLGDTFKNYTLKVYALGHPLKELIPEVYTNSQAIVHPKNYEKKRPISVVTPLDKPFTISAGLKNKNLAIWHSHGWYYEPDLDRWEWQRARAFQTVEDLLPMAFIVPYLTPMLENAGANVYLPRERDVQTNEVIVDNDDTNSDYKENAQNEVVIHKKTRGFAPKKNINDDKQNPFFEGSYREVKASKRSDVTFSWTPEIPEKGKYAVYISYHHDAENISDAVYTVHHAGGKTRFSINQKIGGETWIYLGHFLFEKGKAGKVTLSNQSRQKGKVTADAVRFGGGMGNITRKGIPSRYPRWTEGARYYLQYAGIPYPVWSRKKGDYVDDYQSRGEWVNYLASLPMNNNDTIPENLPKGLDIPIDLAFGYHTDAGFTRNDTVVGTLMIYDSKSMEGKMPDSTDRLKVNRTLADFVQTELVREISLKYDSAWTRRGLWDKGYSEAYRPNVPSLLLELISHHNFQDMKFAQDPRFRFDVSRTLYKSFLKYLAHRFNYEYVIQPLPVSHFQSNFISKKQVKLQWKPVLDSLEKTAKPSGYMVYTRIGDGGFDNGVYTENPELTLDVDFDKIYSFKITAVNAGGESFPSEILSVCRLENDNKPVLIVNGFDRVSAPATIQTGKMWGFANFLDEGVADGYNVHDIGSQYDYNPDSKWLDDDAPGHGASHGDTEQKITQGNTRDFVIVHGKSIKNNDFSFVSWSDEVFDERGVLALDYTFLDWIAGEEKTTPMPKYKNQVDYEVFTPKSIENLTKYFQTGGKLLLSGAYVGTDLFEGKAKDHPHVKFGADLLKIKFQTNLAVRSSGKMYPTSTDFKALSGLEFNVKHHPSIYKVEAPDVIDAVKDSGATTILRYAENTKSGGVAYKGEYRTVTLGFPIETILSDTERDKLMKTMIQFFNK